MAGERILVVDDDPFMRELLEESLTEAGYAVTSAETGQQAQEMPGLPEVQVALVDLSLPDMEGLELIDRLIDTAPDIQMIILTGYPSLDSAIEALRRGAQDYIVKPFRIAEVQAAVDRALKQQKLQAEVRNLRRQVRELEMELHRLKTTPKAQAHAPRSGLPPGVYGTPPGRRREE